MPRKWVPLGCYYCVQVHALLLLLLLYLQLEQALYESLAAAAAADAQMAEALARWVVNGVWHCGSSCLLGCMALWVILVA